jgi:hypothetical protein
VAAVEVAAAEDAVAAAAGEEDSLVAVAVQIAACGSTEGEASAAEDELID